MISKEKIVQIIIGNMIPANESSMLRNAPEHAANLIIEYLSKKPSERFDQALSLLAETGYAVEAADIAKILDNEFELSVSMRNIQTFFKGIMQSSDETQYKHLRSFVEATYEVSVKQHIK